MPALEGRRTLVGQLTGEVVVVHSSLNGVSVVVFPEIQIFISANISQEFPHALLTLLGAQQISVGC